ncbi:MAG: phage integrase family protein [Firmicutes bacterium]|nr:phage integrase family protein [Bacillota bacterium]
MCNLRLTDVQIGERKGTVTVQNGKGGKYREVPLNLGARKVSEAYLEERGDDGMYLFPSQRSPKTSTRAIQLMLNKYRNLTGIEVTPHTLRHTFCHELVVRKVPLDVIARLAEHMKRDGSANIVMGSTLYAAK